MASKLEVCHPGEEWRRPLFMSSKNAGLVPQFEMALWDPAAAHQQHGHSAAFLDATIASGFAGGFSTTPEITGCFFEPSSPPSRRRPFDVWLLRTGSQWTSLGVLATPDEEAKLRVDEVRGSSLIASWNAVQPDNVQVRPGDRILAVNDAIEAEGMLVEIRDHRPGSYLRLTIEPGRIAHEAHLNRSFACVYGCDADELGVHSCPDTCGGASGLFCGYDYRR